MFWSGEVGDVHIIQFSLGRVSGGGREGFFPSTGFLLGIDRWLSFQQSHFFLSVPPRKISKDTSWLVEMFA